VVGVNRLGLDGNTVAYQGDSMVVDFQGEIIMDALDRPGLHYTTLGLDALNNYRAAFPAWMDQDDFTLDL
jgi:predicted amidohydrolase